MAVEITQEVTVEVEVGEFVAELNREERVELLGYILEDIGPEDRKEAISQLTASADKQTKRLLVENVIDNLQASDVTEALTGQSDADAVTTIHDYLECVELEQARAVFEHAMNRVRALETKTYSVQITELHTRLEVVEDGVGQ